MTCTYPLIQFALFTLQYSLFTLIIVVKWYNIDMELHAITVYYSVVAW